MKSRLKSAKIKAFAGIRVNVCFPLQLHLITSTGSALSSESNAAFSSHDTSAARYRSIRRWSVTVALGRVRRDAVRGL